MIGLVIDISPTCGHKVMTVLLSSQLQSYEILLPDFRPDNIVKDPSAIELAKALRLLMSHTENETT